MPSFHLLHGLKMHGKIALCKKDSIELKDFNLDQFMSWTNRSSNEIYRIVWWSRRL